MEDISPFCEAGDILDFGFKARVDPTLACFTTSIKLIPQIQL